MTKSELIESIARSQKHLPAKDVELAVKHILELMSEALANGERIEIRGFGSFSLHYRPPRMGRNPKTGEAVALAVGRAGFCAWRPCAKCRVFLLRLCDSDCTPSRDDRHEQGNRAQEGNEEEAGQDAAGEAGG